MSEFTRREFLISAAAMAALAATLRAGQPAGAGAPLERRRFGATDMDLTILGFGGAEIGFQRTEQEVVERLLGAALDAGLNAVDTAECYAGSEEAIGKAVSHRRKDYYLFTKVGHMDGRGSADGWTAPSIERSIDRSLQRLKTDHLDLVQLHSCGLDILKKGECIEALEKAKKAGKTRYIGYSGDSAAALYAVESGRFDALQTSVSVADQEAIDLTIPKAKEKNMGVIAKRPIANAAWRFDSEPKDGAAEYWRRLQKLDYASFKADARNDAGPQGAAGTALRFTLSVPGVHTAIVGTTKPERWTQNADLLRAGPLPKAQYDAMRERWKQVAEAGWTGQT